MRALVKERPEPGLVLTEVPDPVPGPGEVRIRVKKAAICGTDMHIWRWDAWAQKTVPVPMVMALKRPMLNTISGPNSHGVI